MRQRSHDYDYPCNPCFMDVAPAPPEGFNSNESPTNLVRARSHEELAGRDELPLKDGVSLREPLYTRDYSNTR